MRSVTLLALSLLLVGACTPADPSILAGPEESTLAADPLPLVRLRAEPYPLTFYSGIQDSARIVVRDAGSWAETWAAVWSHHHPAPPLPEVDFGRDMVVVAGLGARASGGYSILVESAARRAGAVEVRIRKESPGRSCMVPGALTQPVDVALLPRSEGPVRFLETGSVRQCS